MSGVKWSIEDVRDNEIVSEGGGVHELHIKLKICVA